MCGYSSYDREGKKIFVDKYVGRSMKADKLSEMFCHYFQNQISPVKSLVVKVQQVLDAVNATPGVRFRGSSLILAYCLETDVTECKIVDFQKVADFGEPECD